MRLRKKDSAVQDIDISPLIDMVFILLIFFMVSTTFVKDMKLELDRPDASSSSAASTKSVRVYLDKSGEVYIDNQAVRMWVLQSRVRELLKSTAQTSVLVVADGDVASSRLIEVVDQCRLGGAKDVGVATDLEAGAG